MAKLYKTHEEAVQAWNDENLQKLLKSKIPSDATACSLPSRADLSIRITEALEILDDLERSKVVYGGFAKNCLKRIRETLHPENAKAMASPPLTTPKQ